jgi:hypothetical protein
MQWQETEVNQKPVNLQSDSMNLLQTETNALDLNAWATAMYICASKRLREPQKAFSAG